MNTNSCVTTQNRSVFFQVNQLKRRACPLLAALLFLALWGVPAEPRAAAATCPPNNGVVPGPVPGQPGETGWLLNTEKDDKGNVIETWCLQANASHGGPDFGSLWRPAGGGPSVWIGACVFPGGVNRPNKQFVDVGPNGKPNGVPDEFTKVTWFNVEPPPNGTHDWDFSFDPASGNLIINKTSGGWVPVVNTNTGKVRFAYTNKVIGSVTNPAPTNFGGLKFTNGMQITSTSGSNGVSGEALAAALVNYSSNSYSWEYALNVPNFGGSGGTSDPLVGLDVDVVAGDTFTIGGVDINEPFVGGSAELTNNGGWTVENYDTAYGTYVTYVATTSASLDPGTVLDGFFFTSRGSLSSLDGVPWDLSSSNEFIGSSGTVQGPLLTLALYPGNILYWPIPTAVLQQAPSVAGPWTDIFGPSGTYEIPIPTNGSSSAFYRLRLGPATESH
jgi:hypothetical protein